MRKFLFAATCVLSFIAVNGFAGTPAGQGEAVKGWYAPTFESVKDSTQPILLYIYDAKPKRNYFAEKMEGKAFLDNADVASRAKKFRCVRVKADEKSWPAEWTSTATNGAVLMVMSSDRKHIEVFDKNDSSRVNSATLIAVMDAVLNAEPKEPKKVAEKPAPKKEEEQPKDNGLGIKGLGDEKPEKKTADKPTPPKKTEAADE